MPRLARNKWAAWGGKRVIMRIKKQSHEWPEAICMWQEVNHVKRETGHGWREASKIKVLSHVGKANYGYKETETKRKSWICFCFPALGIACHVSPRIVSVACFPALRTRIMLGVLFTLWLVGCHYFSFGIMTVSHLKLALILNCTVLSVITCPYSFALNAISLDCECQYLNLVSRERIQIPKGSRQYVGPNYHFTGFQFSLEFLVWYGYCLIKNFVTAQYTVDVEFIGDWVPLDNNLGRACLVQSSNFDGSLARS